MIDLDTYRARIADDGPLTPTLATLQRLHALHTAAIPFENLAAFLGSPLELDMTALSDKLIDGGRGGWCFEHNLLFMQVLRQIGFTVTGLAARVLLNVPAGVILPRAHMLLLIDLQGERWIADVGFGRLTLTAPLRLEANIEQATTHEPMRLIQEGERYTLQAPMAGNWISMYCFDLQPQQLSDYEMANWYLLHHPESVFVNHLMVARSETGCRHALLDRRYSLHRLDGVTETRVLTSVDEMKRVLQDAFQLRLPDNADNLHRLDARLAQLIAASD